VPLTRHHATAFLGLPADHAVEELRRTWTRRWPGRSPRTWRWSTRRRSPAPPTLLRGLV